MASWSLLETKLHPPTLRVGLVSRPRLDAVFGQATTRGLTLVSAPTGYGKTTLVSNWARTAGSTVAWLTLEPAENDPARFLQYIVAALARAGVVVETSTQRSVAAPGADLGRSRDPAPAQRHGGTLDARGAGPGRLPQRVGPTLSQLLAGLISGRPDTLRIVLVTRSDPPLPLGRWRATGELLEVREAQLRFDEAEADRLLNDQLQPRFGPIGGDRAWRTGPRDGRPACISLPSAFGPSVDRAAFIRGFAGSSHHVLDYLAPEVLAPLDPVRARVPLGDLDP